MGRVKHQRIVDAEQHNFAAEPFGQDETDTRNIRVIIHEEGAPLPAVAFQAAMRIVCAVLFAAACALGIPRLFGVCEFTVTTGSMQPAYPIGALVFTVPCDPTEIQVGDTVSCVMNEDLDVITHRVVVNDPAAGTITTRGDANNSDDTPTLYANVIGVVRFSLPYVGAAISYFTETTQGRVVGLALLGGVVALTLLSESICSRLTRQTAEVEEW